MDAKTHDFKLGVFVLASLALLSIGLFAFGAARYFQKTDLVETYLSENADGLSVEAPVTLRGVRIGRVTRIDFSWNVYDSTGPHYVIVEFEMRGNLSPADTREAIAERVRGQVAKGLRARVKPEGFTGSSLLSLEYLDPAEYPAPPFPWTPRYLCIPSAPGQFGEVLGSVQKTLQNVAQLDLQALTGSLTRSLDSVERVMNRLDGDLIAAERLIGHLDEVNVQELAGNAGALITQLRTAVQEMRLGKLSNNADEMLTGLKSVLGRVDLVVGNLDTGSLNDALANLRLASRDLDDTLRKLQKYPAGFLLGRPPPPATSLEKTRR
jgi:ABC-type transporter Mla subunit MlaD